MSGSKKGHRAALLAELVASAQTAIEIRTSLEFLSQYAEHSRPAEFDPKYVAERLDHIGSAIEIWQKAQGEMMAATTPHEWAELGPIVVRVAREVEHDAGELEQTIALLSGYATGDGTQKLCTKSIKLAALDAKVWSERAWGLARAVDEKGGVS